MKGGVVVVVGAALAATAWWIGASSGKVVHVHEHVNEHVNVNEDVNVNERATAERVESVTAEIRKVSPLANDDHAAARQLAVGFKRLHELSGYFDKVAVRRQAYAAMAADGPALDLAARTLTDPSFARSALGEDQAVARVFAIEALAYAYETAGDERLERALTTLVGTLATDGEQANGQYKDVEQLARAVFRRRDAEEGLAAFAWPDQGAPLPLQRAVLVALYLEQGDKPGFKAVLAERFPALMEASL